MHTHTQHNTNSQILHLNVPYVHYKIKMINQVLITLIQMKTDVIIVLIQQKIVQSQKNVTSVNFQLVRMGMIYVTIENQVEIIFIVIIININFISNMIVCFVIQPHGADVPPVHRVGIVNQKNVVYQKKLVIHVKNGFKSKIKYTQVA